MPHPPVLPRHHVNDRRVVNRGTSVGRHFVFGKAAVLQARSILRPQCHTTLHSNMREREGSCNTSRANVFRLTDASCAEALRATPRAHQGDNPMRKHAAVTALAICQDIKPGSGQRRPSSCRRRSWPSRS
jgi:hypothetical protein